MIDINKLEELGKNISKDFVSENVSLNDGLKKVASENGLNKEQLQRVAETANTETYLELFKSAKDNYVDFDLADFKSVYGDIEEPIAKTASPFELDDYDKDYEDVAKEFSDATSLIKTAAEYNDLTETHASTEETIKTAYEQAVETKNTIPFLENALAESELDFETKYISLEKLAKQAVLGDIPYKDVTYIIKQASPNISNAVTEMLTSTMKEYAPHYDLEKQSQIQGVANPNSELYKCASDLESIATRTGKVEQALLKVASEYQELVTHFSLPLEKTGGSFRVVYDPKAAPIVRTTIKNM